MSEFWFEVLALLVINALTYYVAYNRGYMNCYKFAESALKKERKIIEILSEYVQGESILPTFYITKILNVVIDKEGDD